MNYKSIKLILDKFIALNAILFLSPLLILISIAIYIDLGNPIFFKQKRPGYKSRVFNMYKFRTMHQTKDLDGNFLPNNQRVTKLGTWLRKTSLDELPELFNVLRGDMSFIGPRPLLVEYIDLYNKEQSRRHDVKPGISGWAQINGRNSISWEEKFKLDIEYINNISLILDLKILSLTFWKVIKKENINSINNSQMPKFKGTK